MSFIYVENAVKIHDVRNAWHYASAALQLAERLRVFWTKIGTLSTSTTENYRKPVMNDVQLPPQRTANALTLFMRQSADVVYAMRYWTENQYRTSDTFYWRGDDPLKLNCTAA